MKYNKILLLLFLIAFMNNNAQEIITAGGGTLKDWSHLKKYEKENEQLKKINEPHRVVFMGNSITEGLSNFDKDFFINNPFVNRGISGQTTPQMLIRFKPDVVNLNPKAVVILAGINDISNDQQGIISDLGIIKRGERLILDAGPHLGVEQPGSWKLQSLVVRPFAQD